MSNPVVFGAAAGQREFWSCARHQHPFVDAGPILGPAFIPSPPGPTFFFFPQKKETSSIAMIYIVYLTGWLAPNELFLFFELG